MSAPSPAAATIPNASGGRVLIVEDDDLGRQTLGDMLANEGFETIGVARASEVFAHLPFVDLVLLDAMLPDRDGWSVCREIRSSVGPQLPIIMVTARTAPEDVVRTFEAGADDYLSKPFHYAELMARVRTRLRTRRAEEKVRDALERYQLLIRATNDAIYEWLIESGRLIWNDAMLPLFGYKLEEVEETVDWFEQRIHPSDRAAVMTAAREAIARGDEFWYGEYRFCRRDGSYAYVLDRGFVSYNAQGAAVRMIGSMTDISRRRIAEEEQARLYEASQEAEQRYRMLFENNPLPLWVFDLETLRFLDVNDAAIRHYGYSREEFLHMTLGDVRSEEDRATFIADFQRHQNRMPAPGRYRHQKKDGTIIQVEVTSRPIEFEGRAARVALLNDVTEQERAQVALRESEEQLRQAQKMDAVGRLAGGIAHDFNNLLTAIQGNAQLLLAEMDDDAPMRVDLQEIMRAAERATSLTRQLLAFSRRQVLQPRVIDLNHVIAEMERMLSRLIGEGIRLETRASEGLWLVKADPGQIEQVILNLVVNARDAMPHGGTLLIETSNVEITPEFVFAHRGAAPGPHVSIVVRDSGIGMQAEVIERVFEPFFTTKEQGKGTGLGLSTAYGIIKQTGGSLWAESVPDQGSTFTVFLPVAVESIEATPNASPEPDEGSVHTILLVEDETAVRRLARRILERAGFRVLEAATGKEALEWERRYGGPIHLLLTDVVMPGQGGRALAQELTQQRAGMRLLYMSGYTEDEAIHSGVVDAGIAFLEKPFAPASLVRKVREVLAAPHNPAREA